MTKKIFVPVVALSLFAFSGFAFAINDTSITNSGVVNTAAIANYSEAELVALITKLQKQLELVRQNTVQCVLAEADLSLGDGEDATSKEYTKNLQAFLKEKGYFKLEPTGYYGKVTRAALQNFQRENGIEQTGELNATTRTFIKSLKCRKEFSNKKFEVKPTPMPSVKEVKEPTSSATPVTAIYAATSGNMVKWQTTGYSKNGYKIVYSKNANPTYPTREGDQYIYLTDPNAYNTKLEAFAGTGTYYVRVCEYLGGSCGMYSNEVTTSL
ncbi:MAG: peptidoglycan-binding protein [Candidatus Pacebacteria bacterium]|jgi:peptidoglycan hydrolase-like protein with peptidoglycan-binding domain|nr:peptidoglycan-binding protein [Candidatus Paceibacterota bacterium]